MSADNDKTTLGLAPISDAEAENYLLSACFQDGGPAIRQCLENGLKPEVFASEANRVIFSCISQIFLAGQTPTPEILFAELRTTDQLAGIGGMAYVMQVSQLLPSTASLSYFIDRVRSLYLKRRFTEKAQQAIESLHDGATAADVLASLEALRADPAFMSATMLDMIDAAELDPTAPPPHETILYSIKKVPVLTCGNLMALTGQDKTGKSALMGAMLAAVMGTEGRDYLGLGSTNPEGKAVSHLDFEQAHGDHFNLFQTALRRGGLKTKPAWMHSYSFLEQSCAQRRQAIETILQRAKAREGGTHSLLLDGLADLTEDPNDGAPCFALIDWLLALAGKYDCGIVAALHINPNSENFKTRGHLGSHLQRRAESNLIVEKDVESGRSVVFSNGKQRHKPLPKQDGPCFKWCDEEGMHCSVETLRVERDAAAAETAREMAAEVFAGRGGLRYSAIISSLKTTFKLPDSTSERRFREMRDHGIIEKFGANLWALKK